jgi:hypothetical protein
MWGFDNSGDLSYELNKNAEIYQWSAGVQRLLPSDFVVSVDYSANRSTHLPWGSFAAGTRNRNFVPTSIRQTYSTHDLNSLVANPFQPFFSGPNATFNEPDSRYNDAQIPRINLLGRIRNSTAALPDCRCRRRYRDTTRCSFASRNGADDIS